MKYHGVTFNFGSAKVCSPAYFRHVSLMTNISGLLQLIIIFIYYVLLLNYAISIDSYSPINKF